ncbi:MAG: hypothetical protein EFT35_10600 [Methanophagales archaeon ANME-1-THS]|nr:MAG: hypothetical protein EFT35_10600 [Methanophagales archaeon ANME-1-THS]
MSLDDFKATFNILIQQQEISSGEEDLNYLRRKTIRFLDSLGHCEFDFDRRQVFACPPVLVILPSCGLPKAVLTGARSETIVREIKDFVKSNRDSLSYSIEPQRSEHPLLPSAIYIEAVNHDYLQKVAQSAQIGHHLHQPAAWSLVNFSAGLEDIKNGLLYENRPDLNWDKRMFSAGTLKFTRSYNTERPQGLVEYTNPVDQQRLHWIWDGNQVAEVEDRDWGRYVILAAEGVNVMLYDDRRYLLAVPATVPLPRFLARSATLCSGMAPESGKIGEDAIGGLPAGHPVDIYPAVPPSIALMISEKLSQNMIHYDIVIENSGGII